MNAPLIEYLTADKTFSFTVDTSKDSVIAQASPSQCILKNGNGKSIFQAGDGFILKSYGIMLPENFTFFMQTGTGLPILVLWGRALAIPPFDFDLPIFAGNVFGSAQNIIEENRELEVDGFCNYSDFKSNIAPIVSNYSLYSNFGAVISMLNVPAAANNKSYYAVPFVKIAHNLPLQ